jgi:hypothetical protein
MKLLRLLTLALIAISMATSELHAGIFGGCSRTRRVAGSYTFSSGGDAAQKGGSAVDGDPVYGGYWQGRVGDLEREVDRLKRRVEELEKQQRASATGLRIKGILGDAWFAEDGRQVNARCIAVGNDCVIVERLTDGATFRLPINQFSVPLLAQLRRSLSQNALSVSTTE